MGRHPGMCALIMAIATGFGPTVQLFSSPSLTEGVLTAIAVTMGAGFGLLLSFMVRKGTQGR